MNIFPPPKFSSKAEWLAKTIHHLAPLLNQASTLTPQSFQHDHILRFHTEDEFYSYTHYRFCFPDLPEPLDYLNINVVLGTAGFYVLIRMIYLATNHAKMQRYAVAQVCLNIII